MESGAKRLVVGLGNPGPRYRETRHNAGFMVVDRLSERWEVPFAREKFDAVFGIGTFGQIPVILAKPTTYMNRSGLAVGSLARFFGIEKGSLLIIHDEIDLPFGTIKIKEKGGTGGHKGLESIMETFGSGEFDRLRLGMGRPGPETEVASHVLGRFREEERKLLDPLWDLAGDAVESILLLGTREAMNRYNNKQVIL